MCVCVACLVTKCASLSPTRQLTSFLCLAKQQQQQQQLWDKTPLRFFYLLKSFFFRCCCRNISQAVSCFTYFTAKPKFCVFCCNSILWIVVGDSFFFLTQYRYLGNLQCSHIWHFTLSALSLCDCLGRGIFVTWKLFLLLLCTFSVWTIIGFYSRFLLNSSLYKRVYYSMTLKEI